MQNETEKRTIKTNLRSILLKMSSFNWITAQFIKFSKKYKVSNAALITNNIWGIAFDEAFPKYYMDEMVDCKFENITVKALKNSEKWLTCRYGADYMQLPPVEQRYSHGIKAWRVNEN